MKEMKACTSNSRGEIVKRVFICLALAVALVMAFSGVAYAANWNAPSSRDLARATNPSAQFPTVPGPYYRGTAGGTWNTNLGNAGAPQDQFYNGTAYVSSEGSKYVYLDWGFLDDEVIANRGASSPHGDFQIATVKCAVCHNVHVAAPAELPIESQNALNSPQQSADTLLKFRATDACGYCHVIAGHVVNGSPKWGGMWPLPSASVYGHNLGNPKCTGECHANVHGVNQDLSIPAIKGLMLTTQIDYPTGGGTVLSRIESINASAAAAGFGDAVMGFTTAEFIAGGDATTLAQQREQAVGPFCGGCHFGSYSQVVAGASTSMINFSATDYRASGLFTGHRTMASATTNWNGAGNVQSSGTSKAGAGMQIAWSPVENCKSCHDAWDGFGNKSFPHGWGYATEFASSFNPDGSVAEPMTGIWLLRGAYAGSTLEIVAGSLPESRYLSGHYGSENLAPLEGEGGSLSDGVCLKCHRSGSAGVATGGVGLTF